jgi:hypothetical protein
VQKIIIEKFLDAVVINLLRLSQQGGSSWANAILENPVNLLYLSECDHQLRTIAATGVGAFCDRAKSVLSSLWV